MLENGILKSRTRHRSVFCPLVARASFLGYPEQSEGLLSDGASCTLYSVLRTRNNSASIVPLGKNGDCCGL